MQISPFGIEEYFAQYEFNVPHLLCASDCESLPVQELLDLAGMDLAGLGRLHLGYTESQGHPDLRAAIAGRYKAVAADDVIVLTAPEEGIYITMRTLLEPEDEVVVLSPAYASLQNVAAHICGPENVHEWRFEPAGTQWQLSLAKLESLLNRRTRLLVINFPHNPTGYLPSPEFQAALIRLARHHDLWLFSDEMYRGLELHGRATLPSAAGLYEKAIVLAGLSKVHGLPGLRSGWLVVRNPDMRRRLIGWKHYTSICPPAPSEWLALAALRAQDKLIARNRAIIERNLEVAGSFFTARPELFTWRPQMAGSVALIGLHKPSATAYCAQLIQEAGVLLLPGPYLGYDDHHVRVGTGRADFPHHLAAYAAYLDRSAPAPRPVPVERIFSAADFADVAALRQWLQARGVDVSTWGRDSTKSVGNLWNEIQHGETRLAENPPLRYVDVVQVIVRRDDHLLIEARQAFNDGRSRKRDRPPSEKLRPGEDPLQAAARCLEEELDIAPERITIHPDSYHRKQVHTDSVSYPGMKSCYQFHIVAANVTGLPETAFVTAEQATGPGDPVSRHYWIWRKDVAGNKQLGQ